MTEQEYMLSGKLYDPGDPLLDRQRQTALTGVQRHSGSGRRKAGGNSQTAAPQPGRRHVFAGPHPV
mgnify:CR=1 FL=1